MFASPGYRAKVPSRSPQSGVPSPGVVGFALTSGEDEALLACAIFYRAFDLPLRVATSLCTSSGFATNVGRAGRAAADLDAEYGDQIRAQVSRLMAERAIGRT